MTSNLKFSQHGICDICQTEVLFTAEFDWFRDHLLCSGCGSVPRERALMTVLSQYYPNYRSLKIHESSPGGRGVSSKLARECRGYSSSHFFPDVAPGRTHPKTRMRCENLESLIFKDASFDLVITQDVLEHVFNPAAAFSEIARVLKPGGAHLFTVPLVNKSKASERRAEKDSFDGVRHLKEAQFHGNPIDPSGSLVVMDWGYDVIAFIKEASGLSTHMITINDIDRGIQAEYIEVLISFKR